MRNTNNLNLALYDASDKLNITSSTNSLNHNMELIDAEFAKKMSTPSGGTAGQILTKTQSGFAWKNVPIGSDEGLDTVSFEHITLPNSSTVSNDGTEISVLSYNVGVYNNGNTSKRGMSNDVIDEKVFNIKKLLMDVNPYLIGLQEDIQYIDQGETKDAHEYLYKPIFPVRSTLGGVSVYSKKAFINSGSRSIGNGRCMAWGEISVNGKTLLFISTHPSPDTTAHRKGEYENIFKWISNRTYEWCIISGDFNTIEEQDRTNLKYICETNGFTMANGGYLGWLKTTPYPRSLDNILVSSKCIINAVKVHSSLENDLISDHYPLSAKITLLS